MVTSAGFQKSGRIKNNREYITYANKKGKSRRRQSHSSPSAKEQHDATEAMNRGSVRVVQGVKLTPRFLRRFQLHPKIAKIRNTLKKFEISMTFYPSNQIYSGAPDEYVAFNVEVVDHQKSVCDAHLS